MIGLTLTVLLAACSGDETLRTEETPSAVTQPILSQGAPTPTHTPIPMSTAKLEPTSTSIAEAANSTVAPSPSPTTVVVTPTASPPPAPSAEPVIDDCGNAVGNGDEITSGPSAPEGNDRDSVFRSLTVHPTDPNTVLMGTERNGFVKSTDGGVTWTRHRRGVRWFGSIGYPEVYDIAISPSDPNIVFAATVDSPGPVTGDYPSAMAGVYKSVDGGETWVRKNCGLTNSRVTAVRFDPHDPNLAIAAIGPGERSFTTGEAESMELPTFFRGGLYRTVDGGESWEKISTGTNDELNGFGTIVVTGHAPPYGRPSGALSPLSPSASSAAPTEGKAGSPSEPARSRAAGSRTSACRQTEWSSMPRSPILTSIGYRRTVDPPGPEAL